MAYYLHTIGAEPETGTIYATKAEALADRVDGHTVTFVASESERQTWREREQSRFWSGHYVDVPWADAPWFRVQTRHDYLDDGSFQLVKVDPRPENTRHHYAHVSVDVPGMIAYTPDDEKGIADRQTRIKPGKYLQQYFGDKLTAEQIAEYAARVKAYTSELQIATTADDIARVYVAKGGPTSCMDGRHFRFADVPTRIYAGGDLAVAYIGTLGTGETDSQIAARAVIWPERKLHSTVYGDHATLEHVLRAHGYKSGYMDGAKVRAVRIGDDQYTMPYVDGIDSARLDITRRWFILGSGDYETRNTDGTTGTVHQCDNCGDRCDADECYCSDCLGSLNVCESCGGNHFDEDAGEYFDARDAWFCNGCIRDHSHVCEHCGDRFSGFQFTRSEARSRNDDLCEACHDSVTVCEDCGCYSDETDSDGYCRNCRTCSQCDTVCDARSDRDEDDRCPDCHDRAVAEEQRQSRLVPARPTGRVLRRHRVGEDTPRHTTIAIRLSDGSIRNVEAEQVSGLFYLHRSIAEPNRWTLTHAGTLRSVTQYLASERAGHDLARELLPIGDWTFTNPDDAHRISTPARAVIRRYASY